VPWFACLSVPLLQLTHNSYHLSFELPSGASANMPVASCLLTKALLQGPGDDKPKVIVRPYTPVSAPDAAGHLDLVIKAYPTGEGGSWVVERLHYGRKRRLLPGRGRRPCFRVTISTAQAWSCYSAQMLAADLHLQALSSSCSASQGHHEKGKPTGG
jgi:hypothetical protein